MNRIKKRVGFAGYWGPPYRRGLFFLAPGSGPWTEEVWIGSSSCLPTPRWPPKSERPVSAPNRLTIYTYTVLEKVFMLLLIAYPLVMITSNARSYAQILFCLEIEMFHFIFISTTY
jgi:hypothetical protein